MDIDLLIAVCKSKDRKAALEAFELGLPTPDHNALGYYLGMQSLEKRSFIPVQQGQPTENNRDNPNMRRALRLWKSLLHAGGWPDEELLRELIKHAEKCDIFLRCRGAMPGTYCSVDPLMPGLVYLGKTDDRCTGRGKQGRKVVQLAATSSDSRTPRQLEKWTQCGFDSVKVGTEEWFVGEVTQVEEKWAAAPEIWYVECT